MRRPCPPRDPRSQDHTESRICSGGERLPQVFHLPTNDSLPSPDTGEGRKGESRGGSPQRSTFIRGQPWGNCLSVQAKPGSETRGTALRETGAWRSKISEKGGGMGWEPPHAVLDKLPNASWGIWALPGPPAGHLRAQGHRSQVVYSAPPGAQQHLQI